VLFGVLGVASAVSAIVWTSQTKPTALVTAPGAPDKAGAQAAKPRPGSQPSHGETSESLGLDSIPVAAQPRATPAAPGNAAPAPRAAAERAEPDARNVPKPSETPQEKVELEETAPPGEDVDVENPYRKAEVAKKEAPPPGERGSFNRGAATSALASASRRAAGCKSDDGPTGPGRATVTFSPDGPVSGVAVAPPFAGTSVGDCVATAYRSAQVPAFTGSSVTLPHSFRIP
jgi:hypothetical protein